MPHFAELVFNVGLAWIAGALIGLERSYNGRPAGFRTHSLVALAAASAAVLTFEPMFLSGLGGNRLDPSRLSQGVMTGIGFLGAGVIFKEGMSVQGLTTAASIWACAAVGFLFGVGMWPAGALVTGAVLVTLILFRAIEDRAPWRMFSYAVLRFSADQAPSEQELRDILRGQRGLVRDMRYRLTDGGRIFEYSADLETPHDGALSRLAERLREVPGLVEFELSRVSK
jgi:putative Mg2+ transporter-C (MgtC) family protein